MEETRSKSRNIIQVLALFFVLVILPGGSFYYLRKGFNYQKDAWAELQDRAQIPNFQLQDLRGNTVYSDSLANKIIVANFTSYTDLKDNPEWRKRIGQLSQQFHDREEFEMISYITDMDSLSSSQRANLLENYELRNPDQWHVLYGNQQKMGELVSTFQLPNLNEPYFVLVDTLMVKNYYKADQQEEVLKMAQHISLILPRAVTKDIILERDNEL